METLFSDRAIVSDHQRLYGNSFQRSSAILRFSDSSDPAIVSDHMETRLELFQHYKELLFKIFPATNNVYEGNNHFDTDVY